MLAHARGRADRRPTTRPRNALSSTSSSGG
jgi:hypothetical protein